MNNLGITKLGSIFSKLRRKFLLYTLNNRMGKSEFTSKIIFRFITFLERFQNAYINTQDTGNKDHFVPQFLLRNFSIGESGQDKGLFFEYLFSESKIRKTGIKSSACKKDLYTFNDKFGEKSDFTEKIIFSQNLENYSAGIIKNIVNSDNSFKLTYLEESTLAVFLSHQFTRTPYFLESIKRFVIYLYENKKMELQDFNNIEILDSKIINNQYKVSYEEMVKFIPKTNFEGLDSHIGLLSLRIATTLAEEIYKGYLEIITIDNANLKRFVISDNPIVVFDHQRKEVLKFPAWWELGNKDTFIFLPISPNKCIFYSKYDTKPGFRELPDNPFIDLINFGIYANCSNSVFSNKKEILETHLKMYNKELGNYFKKTFG